MTAYFSVGMTKDMILPVRTIRESAPLAESAFGCEVKLPPSDCGRVGPIQPDRAAIWSVGWNRGLIQLVPSHWKGRAFFIPEEVVDA